MPWAGGGRCRVLPATCCLPLPFMQLGGGSYGDFFEGLTRLSVLTDLTLTTAGELPDCLSALTQLRALHLEASPFAWHAEDWELEELLGWERFQLAPVLRQLTRLTRLFVVEPPPNTQAFPAALTALSQLRRFGWVGSSPENPRLPAGQWLAGLQQLTLPADVAAANSRVWQHAAHLECLGLCSFFDTSSTNLPIVRQNVLPSIAELPCLQRLCLGCAGTDCPPAHELRRLAADAIRRHPNLIVQADKESSYRY